MDLKNTKFSIMSLLFPLVVGVFILTGCYDKINVANVSSEEKEDTQSDTSSSEKDPVPTDNDNNWNEKNNNNDNDEDEDESDDEDNNKEDNDEWDDDDEFSDPCGPSRWMHIDVDYYHFNNKQWGLENFTSIPGSVYISSEVQSLEPLRNALCIDGNIYMSDNSNIQDFSYLRKLWWVGGDIYIFSNDALVSLTGLNDTNLLTGGNNLAIRNNASLPTCEAIRLRDKLDNHYHPTPMNVCILKNLHTEEDECEEDATGCTAIDNNDQQQEAVDP